MYNEPSMKALTNLNLDDETDVETVARRIKSWFENCRDIKWLLIIDNADNMESIDEQNSSSFQTMKTIASLIPKGRRGCVLVTSRNRAANGQLAVWGRSCMSWIRRTPSPFFLNAVKFQMKLKKPVFWLKLLARLPLAIEQAGGFIRETGISIAEYRELYKSNMTEALKEGLSPAHKQLYYRETVATTWEVSFRAIKEKDSLADTILRISAFLDGKLIQKDLFYGANLMVRGSEVHASEWEVNKAFGTLMSYSLVHALKEKRSVEMHLLVQSVIRDVEWSEQLQWFTASAELVDRRFPWGGDIDNLKGCINYLSQAQNSVMHAQELQVTEYNYHEFATLYGWIFPSYWSVRGGGRLLSTGAEDI